MRESPMFSGKRLGVVWVTNPITFLKAIELAGSKRQSAKLQWVGSIPTVASDLVDNALV